MTEPEAGSGREAGPSRFYRPMVARDTAERHRASTPLELLFDLCFVVAVSQASGRLHHALSAGEIGHGVGRYLLVFFAIWWAWVNFTWFASAYDNDDVPYRLTTMVVITGALILAAGIPRAFDGGDLVVLVIGYVVMRLAMVAQWVRAAISDPPRRVTALRFAVGIAVVQVAWVVRLWIPADLSVASFLFLVACELAVPVYAERAAGTTWHPTHIAERYGLFTLIVLGESVLASTTAVQAGFDVGGERLPLLALSAAALVIVFAIWWVYFDRSGEEVLTTRPSGFLYGYGHYVVFASAAAIGAGITVEVDALLGVGDLSTHAAAFAVAIPVAGFLASVWFVHRRPGEPVRAVAFPVAALLVLAAPFGPEPLALIAAILVGLVALTAATSPKSSLKRTAKPQLR
ncbi:MAG TPA: low temperature requirement protein A [Micromonosporaceae bacterium]|nr:low temperature requirement protein A [Micromonosporaceae bacterium]